MIPSVLYWSSLSLSSLPLPGLKSWLESFDEIDEYVATKGDAYTHVMDIPPQYGPGYSISTSESSEEIRGKMTGKYDGHGWYLNVDTGMVNVDGTSCDEPSMPAGLMSRSDWILKTPESKAMSYRNMAGSKLIKNSENVVKFSCRGGSGGSKNRRKSFAAVLADPYAAHDDGMVEIVGEILSVIAAALTSNDELNHTSTLAECSGNLPRLRDDERKEAVKCLEYFRDRIGVPRDMGIGEARELRAHLNWVIGFYG